MRDSRDTVGALEQVSSRSRGEPHVPLTELATVKAATGPAMLRTQNGLLTGYVYVDLDGRDVASYIREAAAVLDRRVRVPPGSAVLWSGQHEGMLRVRERLRIVIPVTLMLVVVLLYVSTRSLAKTAIVCLAVPFSAVGAVWFLFLSGLQRERRRLGWLHRSCRRKRRDRPLHAAVPGSRVREGAPRGPAGKCRRAAGRDRRGRGHTHPAEVHDRGDDDRWDSYQSCGRQAPVPM